MSLFTPNPGQRKAIQAPLGRPTRAVAGAGTGKTEVISRRFVHLLEQDKTLRPDHFLVLTFSEKAAAEMRARIFRAVTGADLGFHRLDLASAAISTFHSFASKLLADHSLRVGLDPDLPLVSDIDVEAILDELKETFYEEGYHAAYPNFAPLEQDVYAWEKDEPLTDARAILDQLRNQAIDPEAFRRQVTATRAPSAQRQVLAPLADWLYRAYVDRLKLSGQLDFDQMIMGAADLLETDLALRETLRGRYRVILVDEYQDTNYAQARLLAALAADGHSNVTVVGDPRQAIYVWREARVENIARFPAEGPANDLALTENRRSLTPILDVANRAILGYDFGDPPEFSARDVLRPCKENQMFTGNVVSLQAAPTREEEAQLIVAYINEAHAAGHHYRDIALLLRARTYLAIYTDALHSANIPFELTTEDAFYTRPEILDAIHLLQVCVNPAQDLSLARVLLSPAVGLTQAQAAGLKQPGVKHLWQAVIGPANAEADADTGERLSAFVTFWQAAQQQRWLLSPAAFVTWALRQSGLEAASEAVAERALRKLVALSHAYEAEHPADSLRDLVEHLRAVLDGELREKAPEMSSDADAVRVLTAHASKGLEFPVVIAADSRQKVKANKNNTPFHEPEAGLVFPAEDADQPQFIDRTRRARNEGRCLWYVTLTRAKQRLIVTATNPAALDAGRYPDVKTFFEELWNKEAEAPTPGVGRGGKLPRTKPTGVTETARSQADTAAVLTLRETLAARVKKATPEFHFSPTAFRRYQTCPAAYRYDYVAGLGRLRDEAEPVDEPEGATEAGHGAQMGTVFHQAVAVHARLGEATAERLLQAVDASQLAALTPDQQATVRGWLERYLLSALGRQAPEASMVERELTLTLDFEPARLAMRGKADRLEPGRLVDFKTDAEPEGLTERYGDQLRLYALAARQAGWLESGAELVIYHAPTGGYMPVPFTPEDEARLKDELAAFAQTLAQPEPVFPPVRSEFCRWCAARETVCERTRKHAHAQ